MAAVGGAALGARALGAAAVAAGTLTSGALGGAGNRPTRASRCMAFVVGTAPAVSQYLWCKQHQNHHRLYAAGLWGVPGRVLHPISTQSGMCHDVPKEHQHGRHLEEHVLSTDV